MPMHTLALILNAFKVTLQLWRAENSAVSISGMEVEEVSATDDNDSVVA